MQVEQAFADGGAPAEAERDSAAKLSAAKAKPAAKDAPARAASSGLKSTRED